MYSEVRVVRISFRIGCDYVSNVNLEVFMDQNQFTQNHFRSSRLTVMKS